MKRTKITSIGIASMLVLALSLGLAACGNSGATSASSTESGSTEAAKGEETSAASTDETSAATTEETTSDETAATSSEDTTSVVSAPEVEDTAGDANTTEATATDSLLNHEGSWSGTSDDGWDIYYEEDAGNRIWELVVVPNDPSKSEYAIFVVGGATKTDDGITITDIETAEVVSLTFVSESDSELVVKVGDTQATLTPCTVEDIIAGEDAFYDIWATAEY